MFLATIAFPLKRNCSCEIIPYEHNWKEIGLAIICLDVKLFELCSISSSVLKLPLYEAYFVDTKDFTISAAPLWMSFWTVNYIAAITPAPPCRRSIHTLSYSLDSPVCHILWRWNPQSGLLHSMIEDAISTIQSCFSLPLCLMNSWLDIQFLRSHLDCSL